MRSLVIDEEAKTRINELVQHCAEFPISYQALEAMVEGTIRPIGDSPDHVMRLFDGFRVAFSWEVQSDFITYRHISISVSDKMPSLDAINMLLEFFQFEGRLGQPTKPIKVWIETILDSSIRAINILEPVRD